ncbi:hypothetical protein EV668_2048 [Enterovirga rhinocerotis]|uniref:Uncharacterized protein n=2 Tax=Enterovirga rhinocerotis TaxID=1339210 RepID=A0A4V6PZN9_9HYPH|nr:hypothetical protein EV668_2048 [Enterovirga rhinocerotis]
MPRAGVREERLRSTAGLRLASPMSSWRGVSGRRYVVGVHPSLVPAVVDMAGAVLIAVRRGGDGTASVVDVTVPDPAATRRSRLRWLALMRTRGATELHVHLLAEDDAERDAVRRDLSSMAE